MSIKELERKYKSGATVTKATKKAIRQQLSRKCSKSGCKTSLSFAKETVDRCEEHPRTKLTKKAKVDKRALKSKAAEQRKKKLAYLKKYRKKHGYKRKTIKRNVKIAPTTNYLPPDTPLVYADYKEPLREIPNGYGYYGTLALSEDNNYVQCHICGNLFTALPAHIRAHKITVPKYKEEFGLGKGTALVGEATRAKMQATAVKMFDEKYDGGLPEHLKDFNRLRKEGKIPTKGHSPSLEWRNKKGLCPDQVLEKIRELADKLGHTPSFEEFQKEYGGRYLGSIRFQHGSYLNAVSKLGMKSAKELKEHTTEQLIENLQEFHKKEGRIPMTSDFNRGLLGANRGTYIARFGSLNNARVEAGLNAVLPMPFGQIMELTPEQYFLYKEGHAVPGKIDEKTVKRRKVKKLRRQAKKMLEKIS